MSLPWIAVAAVMVVLFVVAGCQDDAVDVAGPTPAAPGPSTPAATEPVPSEAPLALSMANTAFAFDLYQELRADAGNLFFSPYSVSAALAMTFAGAAGNTASQMARVLHVESDASSLHTAFRDLGAALRQRGTLNDPQAGEGFDFHVVNAMWPQSGFALLDSFTSTLTADYGAEVRDLDYASDPEAARTEINDWVADETADRIQGLVPAGAVDTLTRLVLTNAIYFNAPWLEPFSEEATTIEPFTRLDGIPIGVSMMRKTETLLYAEWDGGVACEIPYNGSKLTMLVLVPDEGSFESFDAALTAERYQEIVDSLVTQRITLGLPRFEFADDASLVEPLQGLGMTDAFDGDLADFSGITGERDLVISDVLHKAFVSVDEAGTEAAAATAVVFRATGIPAEPIEVIIDRPFLFVIRDRPTGSVLFLGRVMEPKLAE